MERVELIEGEDWTTADDGYPKLTLAGAEKVVASGDPERGGQMAEAAGLLFAEVERLRRVLTEIRDIADPRWSATQAAIDPVGVANRNLRMIRVLAVRDVGERDPYASAFIVREES